MTYKSISLIILITLFVGCKNETIGDISGLNAPEEKSELAPIEEDTSNCIKTYEYLAEDSVVNGSFEEGHSLSNNSWGVFDSVGAWHADTTYIDAGIEIQRGQTIGGLAPSEGESKMEFDAHERNGFTASDVAVYQEIDTESESDYILTFDYSPRVRGNATTNGAEVFVDGQLVATLNAEVIGWQSYSIKVAGAGAATKIMFKGYVDDNSMGGYLDNVKLKKIVDTEEEAFETITHISCIAE